MSFSASSVTLSHPSIDTNATMKAAMNDANNYEPLNGYPIICRKSQQADRAEDEGQDDDCQGCRHLLVKPCPLFECLRNDGDDKRHHTDKEDNL